jgi:hypothetical protein
MAEQQIATRESVVYFVTSHKSRRVKIGWTTNLKHRLSSLQTGNPTPIKLLHTMLGGAELEVQLHQRFADDRTQGEWFRLSDQIREFVFQNGGPWLAPSGSFSARAKDDDVDLRAAMSTLTRHREERA